MEDEVIDDGQILEQESDNEDLWWDRRWEQQCPRCGSKDIWYTDYYWTDDGDDIECSPRCNVCHYDAETGTIIPPRVPDPRSFVVVEGLEAGKRYEIGFTFKPGTPLTQVIRELVGDEAQIRTEPPKLHWMMTEE